MEINPVENRDSGTGRYFAEQNIRKARQAVSQEQMSDTERVDMERKLREAEAASESGKHFQARELASDVVKTLKEESVPDVLLPENGFSDEPKYGPEAAMPDDSPSTKKYQDDSADSSVSFQTATELNTYQAPIAVRAHEGQHVRRERIKADEEGKSVVNTSVRFRYKIDGEGKLYLAGAQTIVRKRRPIDYQKLARLPKPKISVTG